MREALIRMKPSGLPIPSHSEDGDLVRAGVMNEGALSRKLGYKGRPAVAEELLLVRDGMLAADVGGYVHVCHVSTKGSVDYIRRMKAAGIHVTAETCPQYFTLTEEEIEKQGAMAKVNPPLRTGRTWKRSSKGWRTARWTVLSPTMRLTLWGGEGEGAA